jgi:uncharacterized repeat protein (TIGR03803 family)
MAHENEAIGERTMHSARTKGGFHIFDVALRFASTKLAAAVSRDALISATLSALLLIAARQAQAITETVLYNFCSQPHCSDGLYPNSRLTSDGVGDFYGTTYEGGLTSGGAGLGYGTVFELSPNGSGGWGETVLYSFSGGSDGAYPAYSYVIFDSVGNLYGTTYYGGAKGFGVVFELSPTGTSWTETVVHSFTGGADGAYPVSGLIMDGAGNLYGTNFEGIFELSPSSGGWTEEVIYNVSMGYAGVTMDSAGNIFGAGYTTVFKLSPNGKGGWNPTVIHTFAGAPNDGNAAQGTPTLDAAGNLYGTTYQGGFKNHGTVYKLSPGMKGKWTEKILHSFAGNPKDGDQPWGEIAFDTAGNIYGTTVYGGAVGIGTVFEMTAPVGASSHYKEKTLMSFGAYDGANGYYQGDYPFSGLIRDSAGNLYGTTYTGGPDGTGVVFQVTP